LHAAAHLAGIIPRDRPERNGGRKEPSDQRWGPGERARGAGAGFGAHAAASF
jgi:hypothetical protein